MFQEKPIKDFEQYSITTTGKIISYKYKKPHILKTWYQKSGYENVCLCKNNRTRHFLIHRLVAEAFLENPDNKPEVHHKDGNPKNNNVENLEWCTRKENLKHSYINYSPVRNFVKCKLKSFIDENFSMDFETITEAANWAAENLGISKSSLVKHFKSQDYYIVKCRD